jgi:leader peptidase (prepilin peptidase) / N-methyltransferase
MLSATLDSRNWAAVPFHFWSGAFFVFGSIVGSFLNVCIHRLPLGESIVSPPSHCPHCKYSIPWYLNIPLGTWLYLRGKCRNCGAPISIRYFLVELLTAITFMGCWLTFGHQSLWLALVYALFLSGLIVASFIDFEHFIIPDEITIGGMVTGFVCSFLLPSLHDEAALSGSLRQSALGIVAGAGIIYFILRMGKLLFGRQKVALPADTKIIFSETSVHLPDHEIPYEELFYRQSDVITLHARTVELVDRCYKDVRVRLTPVSLQIGDEELNPEDVPHLEAVCAEVVLPREAMGLGDVKFMGAIGAFLGWKAVIFSLMLSSMIGSVVGVGLIAFHKRAWSSRLPYGPYIALASAIWLFGGKRLVELWLGM